MAEQVASRIQAGDSIRPSGAGTGSSPHGTRLVPGSGAIGRLALVVWRILDRPPVAAVSAGTGDGSACRTRGAPPGPA
jgi:hypothetical protein